MKNFFNYVLLALVTVCFTLPLGGKAEACLLYTSLKVTQGLNTLTKEKPS